jgi:hypothetical protein
MFQKVDLFLPSGEKMGIYPFGSIRKLMSITGPGSVSEMCTDLEY